MSIANMLRGHDLFRALTVEEIDKISDFSGVKKLTDGATLFEYHRPGAHIFLLLEGRVHLRLPAEGAELSIVVSKVEKGELFGLSPLLGVDRYTTTAQSVEDAAVLAIEAEPFRVVLQENSLAGLQIMGRVAQVYYGRYLEVLKSLQSVVNQIPLIH